MKKEIGLENDYEEGEGDLFRIRGLALLFWVERESGAEFRKVRIEFYVIQETGHIYNIQSLFEHFSFEYRLFSLRKLNSCIY